MTEKPRVGRCFVVGCPRSGTTLVQSLLAAHPDVWSPPETHFFTRLDHVRHLGRRHRRRAATTLLRDTLVTIGAPSRRLARPPFRSPAAAAAAFIRAMDETAAYQGRQHWVEKTPDHLLVIDAITRQAPGARFVHVVRDGRAVVASLYEVTHAHPDVWHGPWDLERCIGAWNRAIEVTRSRRGHPSHLVVGYPEVVENPERVARRLAAFIGLPYRREMLTERQVAVGRIVADREPWKANVSDAIGDSGLAKFDSILTADQRQEVQRRLVDASDLLTVGK